MGEGGKRTCSFEAARFLGSQLQVGVCMLVLSGVVLGVVDGDEIDGGVDVFLE